MYPDSTAGEKPSKRCLRQAGVLLCALVVCAISLHMIDVREGHAASAAGLRSGHEGKGITDNANIPTESRYVFGCAGERVVVASPTPHVEMFYSRLNIDQVLGCDGRGGYLRSLSSQQLDFWSEQARTDGSGNSREIKTGWEWSESYLTSRVDLQAASWSIATICPLWLQTPVVVPCARVKFVNRTEGRGMYEGPQLRLRSLSLFASDDNKSISDVDQQNGGKRGDQRVIAIPNRHQRPDNADSKIVTTTFLCVVGYLTHLYACWVSR